MNQYIEYVLDDGSTILIEAGNHKRSNEMYRSAREKNIVTKATKSFSDTMETIKPVAETIISKFKDVAQSPDEVSVEFGLKLQGETGAIIATAGVEANFKIALLWKKK